MLRKGFESSTRARKRISQLLVSSILGPHIIGKLRHNDDLQNSRRLRPGGVAGSSSGSLILRRKREPHANTESLGESTGLVASSEPEMSPVRGSMSVAGGQQLAAASENEASHY